MVAMRRRQFERRLAVLLRARQDLVVHVREVANVVDVEAFAAQPAHQQIGRQRSAR